MNIFDKEVQQMENEYQRTQDTIEWAKSLNLDQIDCYEVSFYSWYISLKIAPSSSFSKLRQSIGTGWRRHSDHTNQEGSIFITYYRKDNPDKHLTIIIDALLADLSLCERVQVGIKEVPQYEIVCG